MTRDSTKPIIAVVGGTFDPIHFGHLRLAEELADSLACYSSNLSVRLMPLANPPHREQPVVSARLRASMVKLAVEHSDKLAVDEREIHRDGISYSYLSVQELTAEYPDAALIWVLGDDAFEGLTSWRHWKTLAQTVNFIVVGRPGASAPALKSEMKDYLSASSSIEELLSSEFGKFYRFQGPNLDISSTQIRELLQQKRSCRFLLPDSVIEYIKQHRLYGN